MTSVSSPNCEDHEGCYEEVKDRGEDGIVEGLCEGMCFPGFDAKRSSCACCQADESK